MLPLLALIEFRLESGIQRLCSRYAAAAVVAAAGLSVPALAPTASAAPSAPAAPAAPRIVAIGAAQPTPQAGAPNRESYHASITSIDDDHSWKLVVEGDTVRAWCNDQELSSSQIARDDDTVTLTAHDGATQRFTLRTPGSRAAAPAAEQPTVMVGISLGSVGPALRYHLGLPDDARAIFVENVVPGLPAELAGIHRFDVITSIAGSDGADPATLTDILRTKQPGDPLPMVVIAGGEIQVKTLKLQAFDPDKLATAADDDGLRIFSFPGEDGGPAFWTDRAEQHAAAAAERAEAMARAFSDRARLEADRLVLRGRSIDDGSMQRYAQLVDRMGDDAERQLDELEARLDRLERTLEQRLDTMFDRIERMLDSRPSRESPESHE